MISKVDFCFKRICSKIQKFGSRVVSAKNEGDAR